MNLTPSGWEVLRYFTQNQESLRGTDLIDYAILHCYAYGFPPPDLARLRARERN